MDKIIIQVTKHELIYNMPRRWIIVYLEYQSVCPIVGIEPPHPLPRKRVCLRPWTQRREKQHSLAGEGAWGPNSDDWIESLI